VNDQEREDFEMEFRTLVLRYKPSLVQILGVLSRADRLVHQLQVESSEGETPTREGTKV
jgi:hypothetical protein